MPRGDKTGPSGNGSMTGRQMGYCVGNNQAGFMNQNSGNRNFGGGFGRGRGAGQGRGFGMSYGAFVEDNVSEKTLIENEINTLKDQLKSLEKRLSGTKEKGE